MRKLGSSILAILVSLMAAGALSAADDDAWLGVKLKVVSAERAKALSIEGGLEVTEVTPASPAEEAGLEAGDIVLSAGEQTIATIEQMAEVMKAKRPGDSLNLGVLRKGGAVEPLIAFLGAKGDADREFQDDAKVKELRDRIREQRAELRRLEEELKRRLDDLRGGRAKTDATPLPDDRPKVEETEDGENPDDRSKTVEPERTRLGVRMGAQVVNLEPEESKDLGIEGGIRVTRVSEDSPASEAGLEEGDVITAVNGKKISGTGELRTVLAEASPGDKLELSVLRNGKKQTMTLVLAARE